MPLSLPRWSLLLLLCLLACDALATETERARRPKVKTSKLVRLPGGERLHRDAALAYQRMAQAAETDGVRLRVTSGYRSPREQRWLYEQYRKGKGNKAARPGRSNHQRGLAVDLIVGPATSQRFEWLAANACRFGFRRTVRSEPWHWEYSPRTTLPPLAGEDCLGRPVEREAPPVVENAPS
ncbi:M15 family metallopeptidase [Myxococcus sp. K15C18031901]|uniref:M15 family metallopeptidase n=1 Tax=Myxococcus dinghuensis TaxID=2906761 RepID=UPI0020A83831|nr:M15 family metallopeptidase [Myxococcus dinghuensis]MCP3101682.1 M15 family metallopeptidase [Myxococcus dinghuensis]